MVQRWEVYLSSNEHLVLTVSSQAERTNIRVPSPAVFP